MIAAELEPGIYQVIDEFDVCTYTPHEAGNYRNADGGRGVKYTRTGEFVVYGGEYRTFTSTSTRSEWRTVSLTLIYQEKLVVFDVENGEDLGCFLKRIGTGP